MKLLQSLVRVGAAVLCVVLVAALAPGLAMAATGNPRLHGSSAALTAVHTPRASVTACRTLAAQRRIAPMVTESECDQAYHECTRFCKELPSARQRAICYAGCSDSYGECLNEAKQGIGDGGSVDLGGGNGSGVPIIIGGAGRARRR